MSHIRKDTLARTQSWNKHLRPEGKQRQASAERRAAKRDIRDQEDECERAHKVPEATDPGVEAVVEKASWPGYKVRLKAGEQRKVPPGTEVVVLWVYPDKRKDGIGGGVQAVAPDGRDYRFGWNELEPGAEDIVHAHAPLP